MCSGSSSGRLTGFRAEEEPVERPERLDSGHSNASSECSTLHSLRRRRESKDFASSCDENISQFSNAERSSTRMWSYSMAATTCGAGKSVSIGASSCNIEAASPLTSSTLDYSDINYSSSSSEASKSSPESKSTKERFHFSENGRELQHCDMQVHERQGQENKTTGDERVHRRLSSSDSGSTNDKNQEFSLFTRRTADGGEQQKQRQLRSVSLDAVATIKPACNPSFGRSNYRRQWKFFPASCRSLDTLSVRDEMILADGSDLAAPAALDSSSSEKYQIHSSSPLGLECSNSEVWIRSLSAVVAPYAEHEEQRATAGANAVNAAIGTSSAGDMQQRDGVTTERCSRTSLLTEFQLPSTVYDEPFDCGSDLERHSPSLVSAQRQRKEKPLDKNQKLQQPHEEEHQSEWEHAGKAVRASNRQQRHLSARASSKATSDALKTSRKSSFHDNYSASPPHAVESRSYRALKERESHSITKSRNGARLPNLLPQAGGGDSGSEDCVLTSDVPSTRQGRRLRSTMLPNLLLSQQQRSSARSCAAAHSSPLGDTSTNKRAKGETATTTDRNRENKLNSPFPGVKYCRSRNAWIARWSENGQEKWKTFPVKDSSFEEARRRALEFRQEKDRKKFERLWQQLNNEGTSGGGSAASAVTHSNSSTGSAGDTPQTSPVQFRSEAEFGESNGSSSSTTAAGGTNGAGPGCNSSSSRRTNDRERLSCAVSGEAQSQEDSRGHSKMHQEEVTREESVDTAIEQALKERRRLLLLQQELLQQQLQGDIVSFTCRRTSCREGDEDVVTGCKSDYQTRNALGTCNSVFAEEDESCLSIERSVRLDSSSSTELLQRYTCTSSSNRGKSFALPSPMRAQAHHHIQLQEQGLQQQHAQVQPQQQERQHVQAVQQPQQGQNEQEQLQHCLAEENNISGSVKAHAPLHGGSELLSIKDAFRCSTDVKKTDLGAATVGVESLLHLIAGRSGTEESGSDICEKSDSTTARDGNLQQHKGQTNDGAAADNVFCKMRDTSIGSECLEGGRVLQALLCMLTGQNTGLTRRDEFSSGKIAPMAAGHKSDAFYDAVTCSPCAAAAGEMHASRKRRSCDGDIDCIPADGECAASLNMYKAALLLIMDDLLQNGLPLLAPSVVLGTSPVAADVSPSIGSRSGESLVFSVGEQQQYQEERLPPSEKELRAHKAMRKMLEEQRRIIAEAPVFVTVSPFVKLFELCIFEQKLPSQADDACRTQLLYLNALNALYEVALSGRKSCRDR